jgi:hypothetical protein
LIRFSATKSIHRLLRSFLLLRGVPISGSTEPEHPEEWPSLLPALRTHRLRPLAYWVARSLGLHPPAVVAEELQSAFYSSALRHDRLRAALAEIADTFARNGLRLIVLKGLSLAERLYPDPACRPMEDIDILVSPEHLPSASRLIASLGYSDRTFGIEDYRNPETGIVVDLHTELLNSTRLPVRRVAWDLHLSIWWNRAHPSGAHPAVFSLDPQDDLVYLCHHAWLHHGLQRPLGLLDICQLFSEVEQNRLKPQRLLERDDIEEARRGLWYALASCEKRLGLSIPPTFQRALCPAGAGIFERAIHRLATRGWLPTTARYIFLWLAIPRQEKQRFLRQSLSASRKVIKPGSSLDFEP